MYRYNKSLKPIIIADKEMNAMNRLEKRLISKLEYDRKTMLMPQYYDEPRFLPMYTCVNFLAVLTSHTPQQYNVRVTFRVASSLFHRRRGCAVLG